ncbi:MAG: histidine kinase [Flavobacteriales bacterium]|nr:histidine kinase [Flavobacteriales bacterium]
MNHWRSLLRGYIRTGLSVAVAVIAISASAQPFPEGTPFRMVTSMPQLQDRRLGVMEEDGFGRVWIASWEGLFTLNGTTVQRIISDPADSTTIPSQVIRWLVLQGDTTLWLATQNGVCAWDIANGKAVHPAWAAPFKERNVVHITLIDEALWFGVDSEMVRVQLTTGQVDRYALPRSGSSMVRAVSVAAFPGRSDRVIVTTSQYIAELFPAEERFEIYADANGSKQYATVPALVHAGWIWAGSWGQGVRRFKLDHSKAEHLRIQQMNDVPGGYTTSVWAKDDSTLWVASEYGILELDARSGSFGKAHPIVHAFHAKKQYFITTVHGLRDGTALAGTDDGLARLTGSPHPFKLVDLPDDGHIGLTPFWVMAMAQDKDGDLVIGTYDGLGVMRQRAGKWEVIPTPPSADDGRAARVNNILCARDGSLWIATRDGPMVMPAGGTRFQALYPEERFWTAGLCEDKDGRIWIGTGNAGVIIHDPRTGKDLRLKHDDADANSLVSNNTVRAFCEDTLGRMWIGMREGLSVYDPATERFLNFGQDRSERIGFQTPFVYSIVRDSKGAMWISLSNTGIRQVNVSPDGAFSQRAFDHRSGIDPSRTLAMRIDGQDRIWAVDKGVLMLDTRTGAYRHFNRDDGLLDLPDGDSPLLPTGDGRLVLGIEGEPLLQVFEVEELLGPSPSAPIEFISIATAKGELLSGRDVMRPLDLRIPYADLPLYFEFAAIDQSRAHAHRYAYRLEGLDASWRSLGTDRGIRFAVLDPGDYVLHVRSGIGGGTLANERVLRFTIVPPWYRTTLARVLGLLSIAGIVLFIFLLRVRAIRREEQRKTAFQKKLAEVEMHALRAQMNPHFLFNSLNSIKYYAMTKTPRETADYLGKFAMLIRRILQNSREDLVPLHDELEALRLYVEIESMRLEDKFDHAITIADSIDAEMVRIPPMLMQPYVENAIWHGLMNKEERGALRVAITQEGEELRVVIEDNGVGRKKAEEIKSAQGQRERSFGMRITAERMELSARTLGIDLRSDIEDLMDENGRPCGTRVVLHIPIVHETIT